MKNTVTIIILFATAIWAQAQELSDVNDHPLFECLPGFQLYDYKVQDFGAYKFCDINGENFIVEGQITYYYYESDDDVRPKSILNKFVEIGDSLHASMYGDGENQLYLIAHLNNRRVYLDLYAGDFYYTLNIIERGELKSEITDDDLRSDLVDIGKAVLYFNFKRQECELTSDCKAIIEMIARALKSEPEMGISIDAYTDNIGRSDLNLELSRKRAETIYNELLKQGIDEQRMVYNGYGEENPIADNNTVMGRAFNNRIELVKK